MTSRFWLRIITGSRIIPSVVLIDGDRTMIRNDGVISTINIKRERGASMAVVPNQLVERDITDDQGETLLLMCAHAPCGTTETWHARLLKVTGVDVRALGLKL